MDKPIKFSDPDQTITGQKRAIAPFTGLTTLWFNTGTLCNIECVNCYIKSSPKNDALVYLTTKEVISFLEEIKERQLPTKEIGFTGGEPFMNPDMLDIIKECLDRNFQVLLLSNAMQPMQRPKIKEALLNLKQHPNFSNLTIRVSLDHYTKELHERERGANSWDITIKGLNWLVNNQFKVAICGRTLWDEDKDTEIKGYRDLCDTNNYPIDVNDSEQLMLLPEMDEQAEVPEITEECWSILGLNPTSIMCASSRMIIKRKGEQKPVVLPCTLLPYAPEFTMGHSLNEAARADGGCFSNGNVKLNHIHCAKFCVLGGGSCSA